MSSTVSIWLQFGLKPFFLASEGRIQKHTRIHQHHALIFGGLKGLKQCGNDNSCPHARPTNGPCEPPTPGGKEELPYKKRKGLPRKSKGFHEIGHKHHGFECINIRHIIYLVPLRHDVRSNNLEKPV